MILHVLNGDGTFPAFEESGIEGDTVIWREILSEGPVENLPEEEFFKSRADYMGHSFGETTEKYFHLMSNEFSKIRSSDQFDEIYLWFEHDLICQVNLIYLLKTLLRNRHSEVFVIQFFLDEEWKKRYKGFGTLNGTQLAERFRHKTKMNKGAFEFAATCWSVFAGDDPLSIEKLLSSIPTEFPYLKEALVAHLRRFPSTFNGLNALEQQLLEMVRTQPLTQNDLIWKFIAQDTIYGITDSLTDEMIKELSPELLLVGDLVSISQLGEEVLSGEKDFIQLKTPDKWIGGYHLMSSTGIPRWNIERGMLLMS